MYLIFTVLKFRFLFLYFLIDVLSFHFKKKLSSIDKQRQMNIHLERNNAVYKAYGNIVESIKFKSEKLEEQANSVSHILGLKYSIEENSDSSTIEVRVDFKEEKSFYVKFIYDLQTDDFDCKHLLLFFLLSYFLII